MPANMAAACNLEWGGHKYYFISDETRREFAKQNKIAIVSTADDKIVKILDSRGYPDLVTMEPSGRYAFVTNRWADAVTVIDLGTHKQVKSIAVGKAPHGMALRP